MAFTHLALLRGINVGGKNVLPMKDLARIFTELGCADVRTYIQSGNVLFNAGPELLTALAANVAARIFEQFGYRVPVIVRTHEQLRDVLRDNPYLEQGASENALHVMFLADPPTPEGIAALDPARSSPDAFVVHGQEIYLHLPNGVADTKLTNAYFDSRLATVSTSRNWRTLVALLDLMSRSPSSPRNREIASTFTGWRMIAQECQPRDKHL